MSVQESAHASEWSMGTCNVELDILPVHATALEDLHNARLHPPVQIIGGPGPVEADVHPGPREPGAPPGRVLCLPCLHIVT